MTEQIEQTARALKKAEANYGAACDAYATADRRRNLARDELTEIQQAFKRPVVLWVDGLDRP